MLHNFMLSPAKSDILTQVYSMVPLQLQACELLSDILGEQYGAREKIPFKE